jgi:uncharacterized Tic20 family protein
MSVADELRKLQELREKGALSESEFEKAQAAVSALLVIVVVGILLLMVLGILMIAFPIVGGIKANNGEVWRYPLPIPFFK